ncbi:hypothetical protein DU52_15580 [Methanosarcina mazei]|uniref:DUF2190 domain-containing protein n=1 Tax=Methanosarcina mazei TaxID=2209 RepID=A0A0F8EZ30_METMZ|nr:hypothetical protein [Methanosarcina mazei]KKG35359.1 hypothetical protein DU52_15580 [Methanosarcina mazei]
MSNLGLRKPTNKIVAAGKPLVMELNVETATNVYPGRLVKKGTNDNDIVVCGAGENCIGWAGYEQVTNAGYMPTDVDTIYAAGAQAPVLYGGGFVVVATLADNQTIAKGDRLVAAANGEVTEAIAAACTSGAAAATAVVSTTPTITGSVGIGGIVVGIALESVTTNGATSDLMVLSLI